MPLGVLFAPCQARQTAKMQKRWLLVNIQRDDVFASHLLNRDVWTDELIQSMVESGFVLWQVRSQTTVPHLSRPRLTRLCAYGSNRSGIRRHSSI
jgi:hypothetical protein